MAVETALLRVACNTTTGNQDFTTTDFGGGTPELAFIITSGGITDGSESPVRFQWCATDGSTIGSTSYAADDNVSTSNATRNFSSASIEFLDPGGAAYAAGTVSLITNGIRINWTNAPASALLITVVLIGGTDFQGQVDVWPDVFSNGATDTHTTGFQPNLILAGCSDAKNTHGSGRQDVEFAWGAYDWDGGTSPFNATYGITQDDAAGTSETASQYSTTDLLAYPDPNAQGDQHHHDISAITSTSYTVQNNSGITTKGGWSVALNFTSRGYKVWEEDSPTTTGNWSTSNAGFRPQLVIGFLGFNTAAGIDSSGTVAGAQAVTVFTPDAEFCNAVMMEDGQASAMRNRGISDNTAINMPLADGTAAFVASHVSMDTNGFTLNFSTANGTSRKWMFIAIEGEAVAGDTSNLALSSFTVSGFAPTDTTTEHATANLAQGAATATGFSLAVTVTDLHDSILAQGTATYEGFVPTVTLSQDALSTLEHGASASTGFAPTAATTERVRSDLELGATTVTGFSPTDVTTEHVLSGLQQGVVTVTGFAPTATTIDGNQSNLELGAESVAGFAPAAATTEHVRSDLELGAATVAGFAPTVVTTEHILSGLPLAEYSLTGFTPTTTTIEGNQSVLELGTVSVAGFAPTVTQGQNSFSNLDLGASSVAGFSPTAATTGFITSNLDQGASTASGFAPESTITAGEWSALEHGSYAATGFSPTAVTTNNHRSSLEAGAVPVTGFLPTVTLTQARRSNLVQDTVTVNGFAPLSSLSEGDRAELLFAAAAAVGLAPAATLTESHVSSLMPGAFSLAGLAPAITATGVVARIGKKEGAGHGSKRRGYYRKILLDGLVHVVHSQEEELALWEAHLEKVSREKPGLAGRVEAKAIARKIEIVGNTLRAAEVQARYDPRKNETLLMQYSQARRKLVRSKIRELLASLE